jgi:hypothetical protein
MKKLLLLLLCVPLIGFGQKTGGSQYASKRIAEHRAIEFLINDVLGIEEKEVMPFMLESLSASASGEITTLFYYCEAKDKAGLLIGFFNENWVPGATYERYSFFNLNTYDTKVMLNQLSKVYQNWNNGIYGTGNSIYFKINDITFVMDKNKQNMMRVFWKDYDSDWGYQSFHYTKQRFEKYLKRKEK